MASKSKSEPATEQAAAEQGGVVWKEDAMRTEFANVVNVQGTREQVDIFFGTNRTWSPQSGAPVVVELSNRMIMTPLAAKRLSAILDTVLREHERRYGVLEVE
jgi:hypothetical protein